MIKLNSEIAEDKANLGSGFCIGHSFFCDPHCAPDEAWYASIVEEEIMPLLEEYCCDRPDAANSWRAQLLET